jgi:hypothetical protein
MTPSSSVKDGCFILKANLGGVIPLSLLKVEEISLLVVVEGRELGVKDRPWVEQNADDRCTTT